jgi:hypothetical protein
MVVGLSASLPESLYRGLVAHGVTPSAASHASHLSPISTLFAAFLGYNPIQHLVGAHVLAQISPAQRAVLAGRSFFPSIISAPFRSGLHAALDFAIVASLLAAAASWTRGAHNPAGDLQPVRVPYSVRPVAKLADASRETTGAGVHKSARAAGS